MKLFGYCIRFSENQLGIFGLPLKEEKNTKQQKQKKSYSFDRNQSISYIQEHISRQG